MICQMCKYAGTQYKYVEENARIMNLIEVSHSQCPGGTWCDCAHILSTHALNLEKIRGELPMTLAE